jgi:hypothetical protein
VASTGAAPIELDPKMERVRKASARVLRKSRELNQAIAELADASAEVGIRIEIAQTKGGHSDGE